MFISEFEAVKNFCRERDIPFNYLFRGSKYAAYRLKPDDSRVLRLLLISLLALLTIIICHVIEA